MMIEQLVPIRKEIDLSELCDSFKFAQCQSPFADDLVMLIDEVAQLMFSDPAAKGYPEVQALAFFMRRSSLLSMKPKEADHQAFVRVPLGRVLHFAPANVDTMFVYSWLLSAATGNVNLVRVSKSRRAPQTDLICDLFNRVLEKHDPEIKKTISVVSYDHSDEITSRLSAIADLRVIWGGDQSIDEIRKAPLRPAARDLTFPDRFSISVINSSHYLKMSDDERVSIANSFFNDSYWFDQAACSSPRQIFWCGDAKDNQAAKPLFFDQLSQVLSKRSFALDAGPALTKLANIYNCVIEAPVTSASITGNELAVLELEENCTTLPTKHPHLGTFFTAELRTLADLLPMLTSKIQTLTYLGFERDELTSFAESANGAGVDRIVPIGQALSFHRLWDGFDLVEEYTKLVHIR